MAFTGYLFKVEGRIFPLNLIKVETYDTTPNITQDEDSFQDGDGYLNRKILPHKRSKFEFETPRFNEQQNDVIKSYLVNQQSLNIEYWNPRKGLYEQGKFYAPDLNYVIYNIEGNNIIYKPMRIAFIEY